MTTTTLWKVEYTHQAECAACEEAAAQAITMARVTGSTGATYEDGQHVARVERTTEASPLELSIYAHPVDCQCPRHSPYDYIEG